MLGRKHHQSEGVYEEASLVDWKIGQGRLRRWETSNQNSVHPIGDSSVDCLFVSFQSDDEWRPRQIGQQGESCPPTLGMLLVMAKEEIGIRGGRCTHLALAVGPGLQGQFQLQLHLHEEGPDLDRAVRQWGWQGT